MSGFYKLIDNNIPFSLGLIDVDNFKYINDNYGHQVGDKILTTIISKVRELLDSSCTVGRYGGDEFIIVLKGITEYDILWKILHRVNFGVNSLNIDNIVELENKRKSEQIKRLNQYANKIKEEKL